MDGGRIVFVGNSNEVQDPIEEPGFSMTLTGEGAFKA
jgi:hypothetical protein